MRENLSRNCQDYDNLGNYKFFSCRFLIMTILTSLKSNQEVNKSRFQWLR